MTGIPNAQEVKTEPVAEEDDILNVTSDSFVEVDDNLESSAALVGADSNVLNVSSDSLVEIDVVNSEPSTLPPIVLPVRVQDSLPSASSGPEIVYSSLPPDLNADALARITRTSFSGENFLVKKVDGKLRIFLCAHPSPSPLGGFRKLFQPGDHSCVVCKRMIADGEMYINFPDDLDRRRVWGNFLGFRYTEVLRMRTACRTSLTSCICTDHFTEECFRKFNFNKAAVEAFGMPISIAPKLLSSPVKTRSQWCCPICSSSCGSVGELYRHMMTHSSMTSEDLTPKIRELLYTKGIGCPFCRRCTYLYKTISGFNRHLNSVPLEHFYLKRIYNIAKENFRSSVLEPAESWDSWSDRNIYFAYHGCEPPSSTQKKPLSGLSSTASSPPKAVVGKGSTKTAIYLPKSDTKTAINKNGTKLKRFSSDGILDTGLRAVYPVKRIDARRVVVTGDGISTKDVQGDIFNNDFDPNGPTIADMLNKIKTEDIRPLTGLGLIETTALKPSPVKQPIANKQRLKQIMTRKTQRQLESHEARLRLFGDSTFVEIPHGYVKIDTPKGVRLVNANSKTWEEHLAPSVRIANRRFQRVFTYEGSRV